MFTKRTSTKRRTPLESYNKVWLGAIGLAIIGVLIAAVVLISALDIGKRAYSAHFAQAAQIASGNKVTVAGIQVGEVTGVKLAGDHVVVRFSVDKNLTLGVDTRAAIKLTTILGARYLELSPAGAGEIAGDTIELTHTQVPYDLQNTLAGATDTLGPVDADRIAQSVRVLSGSMQGLPDALPKSLENLDSLAGLVQSRRDQLGTLLTNVNTVVSVLHGQQADLGALVLQGNQILGEATSRQDSVRRLFAGISLLVDRAHTILADEPELDALLKNMSEFATMMADHDSLLRDLLQTAPITIRNLTNATGSGNSIDLNLPAGIMVDSWMCAISGRAQQFNLVEYFKDCK